MLIGEIKRYIKKKKAVSITELSTEFNIDTESLDIPLRILIEKGFIEIEKSKATDIVSKCKACPMTCKLTDAENCSASESFNIYVWKNN